VLIQLGPEFPVKPPAVYWLSPIFHPNVFPTYDGAQTFDHPDARGLVCLGMFAESWMPSTSFGVVLELLVAMAGYRNYELFDFSELAAGRDAPVRANFFDRAAADWVMAHQGDIERLGGTAIARRVTPGTYLNLVARMDPDAPAPAG
jgi:hypothetical protein